MKMYVQVALAAFLLCAFPALPQTINTNQIRWPQPSCAMAGYTFSPQSNTCIANGGGGGTPSGPAGGDLSGTYPNPGVSKVNGALLPASSLYVGTNSLGQIVHADTPNGCAEGTCVINAPASSQRVVQPTVSGMPSQLAVNNLHGQNQDYPAINNIGDSITWGAGVGSSSSTAGGPGILGTSSQPLAYAWLLQAAYGNAGQNIGYPGDEAADQTGREYSAFAPPSPSGNPVTQVMLGTNDAAVCGTGNPCQTTYSQSLLFIGADRGIPSNARMLATNCTGSGFASDMNAPYGMISTTPGDTLTCTLTTYGNAVYVGVKQTSGVMSWTIDGTSCSAIGPTSYAGTGNNAPNPQAAYRCPSIAAGTHTIVFTNVSGSNEITFTGSAPLADAKLFAPPAVFIGGVPVNEGDNDEPATGIYDGLAQSAVTQLVTDGIAAKFVNVRSYMNDTTSYTGGVVGNQTWCSSNALPYHPGCLGHWQLYQAFSDAMQPLLRNAQAGSLYAGENGSINGYSSTSGLYGTQATILAVSNKGSATQSGIKFDSTGANTHILLQSGSGVGSIANTFGDDSGSFFSWIVGPDGAFCTGVTFTDGANSTTGCPHADTYIKPESGSAGGVQYVIGPQSNAALDGCTYGASTCGAGAHLKLQAPANQFSTLEADASGTGIGRFLLYTAGAPSGNRVWMQFPDTSGIYHLQYCNDAVTSCTDFANYTPSTNTIAVPNLLSVNDFQAATMHAGGSSSTNLVCTPANGLCGGGSATFQVNGTNNASQTTLNTITSTTNITGLMVTPSNPTGGNVKNEVSGNLNLANIAAIGSATAIVNVTGSTAAPTAQPLSSLTVGSAAYLTGTTQYSIPYQVSSGVTGYIAPPSVTGTYAAGWQPSGSAVSPAAIRLDTIFAPFTNITGGANNYAPIASPTFTGTTTTAVQAETGAYTNTANAALSAPAFSVNGAIVTGGTGTTTVPLALFGNTGCTTWNTNGTVLGICQSSGTADTLRARGSTTDVVFDTTGGVSGRNFQASQLISAGNGTYLGASSGQMMLNGSSGVVFTIPGSTSAAFKVSQTGAVTGNLAEFANNTLTAGSINHNGAFVNSVTTITASATPVIDATKALQTITLNAPTTPTVTGIAAGQRLTLQICQPASGGPYTWTWPAAIHGGVTIGTTASTCSVQSFDAFSGSILVAESTGVINVAP